MWKRLKKGLIYSVAVYLGVVVMLALLERTLMYPAPGASQGDWTPEWLEYEDVYLTTKLGNRVHGWFCEHPAPKATVLLCHGNGENVAYMAEEIDYLRNRFQVNVFAFDYRGYGKSEGKPFEVGILADGEAAQAWLAQRTGTDADSILIWGRSLGGAVAVHLAAENGASGLILDRTFCSMVDVASSHYRWLPVRLLLNDRYHSDQRIQRFEGPLLQIHGLPDRVVPYRFGKALFDAAPSETKQLLTSEDLSHNAPWPTDFYDHVEQFLKEL